MKSAEEWVKKLPLSLSEQVRQRELVKQIQLDAMREGMRRAAEMSAQSELCCNGGEIIYNIILSAAEQLTEKDL